MNTTLFLKAGDQAAQAFKESERRYQRLLASVTDYVYCVTVENGRPVRTSHGPGCEAVTGYTPADFAADPILWYRMIYEEDRQTVTSRAERILRGEAPPPLEHRIVRKDGSIHWIRNTAVLRKDNRGQVVMYDGLVSDITERKQMELALQKSEERLALVIQGSNDGTWDWDVTTNEVYFSPRWKSMLGYEDHEVENNFSGWERLLHPDERQGALAKLQAYLSGETSIYELEHRLRHKDGTFRWILARGVALRNAGGTPIRMAGSHVDITDLKRAEENLRKAYAELARHQSDLKRTLRELEAANAELKAAQAHLIQAAKLESIGTLAAGVAHEVKNPLHTILMGVEYLSDTLPASNGDSKQALDDMRDAVTRANAIIRELLEFAAASQFEFREGNLNEVIERSLHLVNAELTANQTFLVRRLEEDLPTVWMDPRKLEQVFVNLFINALQAMPQQGRLSVSTRAGFPGVNLRLNGTAARQFEPCERLVVVEVQDTGNGIPPEHLARVFDPFFTTKPVGVGTGLGLAVTRRILESHGGVIELHNAPEGGLVATLVFRATPEATK